MTPPSQTREPYTGWVLFLAGAASMMVSLDILAVTTALAAIQQDLAANVEDLEWTVASYNIAFAMFLMAASGVGDRIGRRQTLSAGLVGFTVASAACAIAPTADWLIAGRIIQGVSAAFVLPVGLTIVSAAYPIERRGRALGVLGGATGMATLAGPVVGGAITELWGWQGIFWINVPIGFTTALLLRAKAPETYGPRSTFQPLGLTLLAVFTLGVMWCLVRGPGVGWGSAEPYLALGVGLLSLAAFVRLERAGKVTLLPAALFRLRGFTVGNISSALHASVVLGAVFWMAQFFQTGMGFTPLLAGLALLPWTGTMPIVAPAAGWLVDRFGEKPVVIASLSLQGGTMMWVALAASAHASYLVLLPALVVGGIGGSAAFPALQAMVMASVSSDGLGKASGVNTTVREVGGVFGIAILSAVFATLGTFDSSASFLDGFAPAIGLAGVLALTGAAVGTLSPSRHAYEAVRSS